MPDSVVSATRSRMMAGIGGRNTAPELRLRRMLHGKGRRFRLHGRGLPGTPDIVFPASKAVVFVHGCFWHRHEGCHWCTTPKTGQEFWNQKFSSNVERDTRQQSLLRATGWRTAIFWECATRDKDFEPRVDGLIKWLDSDETVFETEIVRCREA